MLTFDLDGQILDEKVLCDGILGGCLYFTVYHTAVCTVHSASGEQWRIGAIESDTFFSVTVFGPIALTCSDGWLFACKALTNFNFIRGKKFLLRSRIQVVYHIE